MEKLPRAAGPEEKGISSLYVIDMLDEFDKRGIELHSVIIAVEGQVVFEGHYNPYKPEIPYIIHSLTKLFTNIAAGMAYTEGKLKLTDTVADYFPDKLPKDACDNLKAMTAKDLITMRSGHGREISGNEWRPLKTSWIDAFMKEPVPHTPGTKYIYSSGNSYMLSAMVQKATGKTCEALLQDTLLEKLGMGNFSWQKSPEGVCSGGNGVMATPEDILKIGVLYLQKGMWKGERLLTEEWCDLALGFKGGFSDNQTKYGFHWWDRGGAYSAMGVFGQILTIVPDLNMAIIMTGGTGAGMDAIHEVINEKLIAKTLADKDRRYEPTYAAALKTKGERLNVLPLAVATKSPLAEKISGRTFAAEPNVDGISGIKLDFCDDCVIYTMADERGIHSVKNGVGIWISGATTMTGNYLHHQYQNSCQLVCASAWWLDGNTLKLVWQYPEMAFRDTLILTFDGSRKISMARSVSVNSTGPFGGLTRPEVTGTMR